MTSQVRVVAYGGGIQSTAMLVLAAQGKIDYQTFLFSNVGDDSEHPGTIRYVHEVAMPFAEKHGLVIHELRRTRRNGDTETLYGRLTKEGSRSLPIPVRMPDTGAPGTRLCTADFKIRVIGGWLKKHGASEENKAVVAVGISLDEIQRINARKASPYEILAYPLVGIMGGKFADLGGVGRPMRRGDCAQLIEDAGLPVPPKSACFFCPFHKPSAWAQQRRDEPELFFKAADLEALLNRRRDELGRDHVYLTRFGRPLAEAIPEGLTDGDIYGLDDAQCDNGWCMT